LKEKRFPHHSVLLNLEIISGPRSEMQLNSCKSLRRLTFHRVLEMAHIPVQFRS